MRLSNNAAKLIFATTAIVLLAISYILYQQIKTLFYAQEQLNETNIVKLKLEQTLSSLKDAETAQRGYLLTHDSIFLQPYYGANEKARKLIGEVRELTSKSRLQQNDVNVLETFADVRFKTFNHVISQYDDPKINAETRKMHLLRGMAAMDSINYYIDRIVGRENGLVVQREAANRKYHFLTPFFAVLLMMVAIGVLAFSYGKIIEQLNRTRKLLSKLKKLNNQLKDKNHKLQLYNKELDSFAFIASHDLKEPLRKILTYTAMVENSEQDRLSEEGKNNFRRIKYAAGRMQNLLDDLLMYSHVTMGEKSFEQVDLNKVLKEVMSDLKEEISEANALIQTRDLPVIHGMPFQIKQLFENLVSNSIKYRQAQLPPAIKIEGAVVSRKEIKEEFPKESSRYYKLYVTDNGLGFEQTYADKVFKLFQRLHTKSGLPGTGIGLTICKKIVDNHNGFIKAVSEVNKGTTFEIYLPAN